MDRLLVIPIYDTVILPEVKYQFGSFALGDKEKERLKEDGCRAILLPLRKMAELPQIETDDFYEIGLIATIEDIEDYMSASRLDSETHEKVRVSDLMIDGHMIDAAYEVVEEIVDVNEEGQQLLRKTLLKLAEETAKYFKGGETALTVLEDCKTMNELVSMFGQFVGMSVDEKYSILETNSFRERGTLITEALVRFKGYIELQADLSKKYSDSQSGSYREAAIHRQIEALEEELATLHPDDASEDTFEKKIERCGMPEEVKREVLKDVKHLRQKQQNDAEYSTLYDYLDFITGLSWKVDPLDKVDVSKARKILERDHYGMEKVKDRILQQIAVMGLAKKQSGTILLLVGAPGTGKTSIGKSTAEAMGRKYARVSLGGVRDEAEIRGHRRTYIAAMPGRIMDAISKCGAMNPVMVLDEVDKLCVSYQGDPSSALLEVLDPEQNRTFTDHYMNVPYDLSNVFFLCTANSTDTIPKPLLDRMEVIQLPGYTPAEKLQIGKRHLLAKSRNEHGLNAAYIKVTDKALERIIAEYTMEAGVRGLKKQLDIACRKAAVKILEEKAEKVSINASDLEEYLGKPQIRHEKLLREMNPGMAVGLAWTQAGGEILFVETAFMKGTGQVVVTGQLGDVMKESVTIASSLVKERFGQGKIDFNMVDMHIHVPSGAVPKDGPSAGITIFTAIASLVTGRKSDPQLAMTGELSLSGRVLPIGGLTEKLLAADRAGIKRVLIPKENARDLEEVPEEIIGRIDIIQVETAAEVIKHAIGIKLPHAEIRFGKGESEKTKDTLKDYFSETAEKEPASGNGGSRKSRVIPRS